MYSTCNDGKHLFLLDPYTLEGLYCELDRDENEEDTRDSIRGEERVTETQNSASQQANYVPFGKTQN